LAAGAKAVVPCLEVDEARQAAAKYPAGQAVLGGERGGLRIEGFDLGNSPSEYTPETVGGRTVVFTTTNGTRALRQCRQASRVLTGALVNLSAVCRELAKPLAAGDDAHLLCAGTRGEVTGEDALLAGAVVHRLKAAGNSPGGPATSLVLNDQACLAELAWHALTGGRAPSPAELADRLARQTRGGRNVTALGLAADIVDAATIDRFSFVPELDVSQWTIVPPAPPSGRGRESIS
jgi:2-phosphosulfolactate phosphatase